MRSIDRKIRAPMNDHDPIDPKDEYDLSHEKGEVVLRNNIAPRYHEDLSGELDGILRNMKDPSQLHTNNYLNLRLT